RLDPALHLLSPQLGPAGFDAGAKPNPGAPDVDGVHHAIGVLQWSYFPTRNHALDLSSHWLVPADDLFHRTAEGHHPARRRPRGVLAPRADAGRDGCRVICALRAALPQQDRVNGS